MQTSYSINIPEASYPGQIADAGEKDVLSAVAVTLAMIYGTLAVTDETNTVGFDALACRPPAASGDITVMGAQLGVVLADQARAQDPSVTNPQYAVGACVPCMRKGRAWVYAETAMTDGTNPYVRFTANGALYPGNFRADADSGKAAQMPAGQAVVRGTTTGAGFCVIEFDIV